MVGEERTFSPANRSTSSSSTDKNPLEKTEIGSSAASDQIFCCICISSCAASDLLLQQIKSSAASASFLLLHLHQISCCSKWRLTAVLLLPLVLAVPFLGCPLTKSIIVSPCLLCLFLGYPLAVPPAVPAVIGTDNLYNL